MSNSLLNSILNSTTKCTKHLKELKDMESSNTNNHNHDHSLMNSVDQHNLHDGMIVIRIFYTLFYYYHL
jgi:hypothetical protein